jgi:hypothetical protein
MPKLYSVKQMEPATDPQINYINSLSDQISLDHKRLDAHIKDWLSDPEKSTFNLVKWEAGLVIDKLKKIRDDQRSKPDPRQMNLDPMDEGYWDE